MSSPSSSLSGISIVPLDVFYALSLSFSSPISPLLKFLFPLLPPLSPRSSHTGIGEREREETIWPFLTQIALPLPVLPSIRRLHRPINVFPRLRFFSPKAPFPSGFSKAFPSNHRKPICPISFACKKLQLHLHLHLCLQRKLHRRK